MTPLLTVALLASGAWAASSGVAPLSSDVLDSLKAAAGQGFEPAPISEPLGRPVAPLPFAGVRGGTFGDDAPVESSTSFPDPVRLEGRLLLPPEGTDYDGDALTDSGEAELAYAFRPFLVFDSHENARGPEEPVTLFQVRPVGCAGPRARCGGKPLVIRIVYLNLWTMDGGYGPASLFCVNKHIGDNQAVTVTVESEDSGGTFRIQSVDIGDFVWPVKSGAVRFLGGTHFWLLFSSGKHHHFFDTRNDHKASPYSAWACRENVDGRGFFDLSRLRAPKATGLVWNNVGEPEAHPVSRFVSDLGAYRFPGEGAWKDAPFCGGLPCAKDNPTGHTFQTWSRDSFFIP